MNPTVTIIIFVVALLLSVGFLLLVLTLVPAINQLKSLLKDLEKTSVESRDLMSEIKDVTVKVDRDIDKVDALLDSSRETVDTVRHTLKYIDKNVLKKSAGLIAMIPAIKFGWDFIKKFKRR